MMRDTTGPATNRRSVLGTIAGAGLLAAVGTSSTAGAATTTADAVDAAPTTTAPLPGADGSRILGVELLDLKSDERTVYGDIEALKTADIPAGEYEIIVVTERDGRIHEDTTRMYVDSSGFTPAVNDGVVLRAKTLSETVYDHYAPGGTATILIGAVERSNGIDRNPATNVELTVELTDPNNSTVDTQTVQTNESGNVRVEFDLTDADNGRYFVDITSEETSSFTSASFNVGPYMGIPFHWTAMTVGEETSIGVFSALGGDPESGVTRDVSVTGPDGNAETIPVAFDEGGIGTVKYTPEQAGFHRIQGVESEEFGRTIGASAGLKAFVPYFRIRNQYVGRTVSWGGHVFDGDTPAPNREIVVILENDDGDVVSELDATTNEFGQFTVDIEAPVTADTDYNVTIEDDNGTDVFLFGDSIRFSELPADEDDPDPVSVSVSLNDFRFAPGERIDVDVSLVEEGEPISDADISLLTTYTFNDVPAAPNATVTTGADGTAGYDLALAEDAPDGERLYVTAIYDHNGETYRDTASASLERYDIDVESFRLTRGEENTIDVQAFDRLTGDPVSGIDVTLFGNRDHVDAETFDTGYTQTDANGEGEIPLSVPGDVRSDIMINDHTPYRNSNSSGGSTVPSIQADVTVSPQNPAPGGSVEISYSTDATESVSAIVTFPSREGAFSEIVQEGSTGEFTVPSYLDPGTRQRLGLQLVSESGEVARRIESLELAAGLTAALSITPAEPTINESVEFNGSSSVAPDGEIESFEWAFGDGSTATGETVTHSYGGSGEYTVELTVEANGESDTTTRTVTVQDPDEDGEEPSVVTYANEEGVVSINGVIAAVNDYTSNEIGIGLMLDVIGAYTSGDPVA